ncbi:hypothetical protein LTR65_007439 [Meristemomyces frigidus]
MPEGDNERLMRAIDLLVVCVQHRVFHSLDGVVAADIDLQYAGELANGVIVAVTVVNECLVIEDQRRQDEWERVGGKGRYDQQGQSLAAAVASFMDCMERRGNGAENLFTHYRLGQQHQANYQAQQQEPQTGLASSEPAPPSVLAQQDFMRSLIDRELNWRAALPANNPQRLSGATTLLYACATGPALRSVHTADPASVDVEYVRELTKAMGVALEVVDDYLVEEERRREADAAIKGTGQGGEHGDGNGPDRMGREGQQDFGGGWTEEQ